MAQTKKFNNTPEILTIIEKYPDKEALNDASLPTKEIIEVYKAILHELDLINEAIGENPNDFDEIVSNMQLDTIEELKWYISERLAFQFLEMWEEAEI